MFGMESTTKIQTSGPTIDGAVYELDIATTPEYIFKITINLAALQCDVIDIHVLDIEAELRVIIECRHTVPCASVVMHNAVNQVRIVGEVAHAASG